MALRAALAALCIAGLAQAAVPVASPPPLQSGVTAGFAWLGVNLASAEFGITDMENGHTSPGVYGKDYTYPTHAEIAEYASAGLNIARVPFSWERMQPVMNGPLDALELGRMDDVVAYALAEHMTILLDPHNYGYGYGHLVGSRQTPNSAFADFWRRMAEHYANCPNVMFGLMNEPHEQTPLQWVGSVNLAIAAIRGAGARQEILAPGTFHANGAAWVRLGTTVFADNVQDPADNTAFEVHQYLDADQSGGSTRPASPTIGAERLADVTAWAEAHGKHLFLGEFGAGRDPQGLEALRNQLNFMLAHSGAWQGGTIWGGGPWWPDGYPWATDASGGVFPPQIRLLQSYGPVRCAGGRFRLRRTRHRPARASRAAKASVTLSNRPMSRWDAQSHTRIWPQARANPQPAHSEPGG